MVNYNDNPEYWQELNDDVFTDVLLASSSLDPLARIMFIKVVIVKLVSTINSDEKELRETLAGSNPQMIAQAIAWRKSLNEAIQARKKPE